MSESDVASASPLAGLCIIDLTRVLAGPVCGRILADLGAIVIKLEPPDGDLSREIAPKSDRGMSRLYTRADVVLENFRPGVAAIELLLEQAGLAIGQVAKLAEGVR